MIRSTQRFSELGNHSIEAYIGQRQYYSYGRAESLSASKYSAILEMIERHASMIPQFTKPLRASYHQLKQKKMDVINPESFILHKSVEGEHLYSNINVLLQHFYAK